MANAGRAMIPPLVHEICLRRKPRLLCPPGVRCFSGISVDGERRFPVGKRQSRWDPVFEIQQGVVKMRRILISATLVVLSLASLFSAAWAEKPDPLSSDVHLPGVGVPRSQGSNVLPIDPSTLNCNATVTFDDVAGGGAPGTNYDAIFESNGADLAERFVGQALGVNGNSDVLSGTPTNPLTLQVGAHNQNLNVFVFTPQVLTGLGPLGYPDFDAIGEGSFAVLFDFDQSEFGFDLVGGDGGNAFVRFFRRDGSLIDLITIPNLANQRYAFRRNGGIHDIAGISIDNDDPAGIGFDNLCHDVGGVVGHPPICDAGGPYHGAPGQSISF